MSQVKNKLIDAISRRYSFSTRSNKGNTRYQLIREYNKPLVGYVYLDDKHIATINYKDDYVKTIHIASNWESISIRNTLNAILKHFSNHYITQKNFVWYWNNCDWEVIVADNLVYTDEYINSLRNNDIEKEWYYFDELNVLFDAVSV